VRQLHGTSSRPVRELKGFRRVSIEAGATEHVAFTLGRAQLQYWNAASRDWVVDAAPYQVGVGCDSTVGLTVDFTVTPS
jgi:beta-glucosidase